MSLVPLFCDVTMPILQTSSQSHRGSKAGLVHASRKFPPVAILFVVKKLFFFSRADQGREFLILTLKYFVLINRLIVLPLNVELLIWVFLLINFFGWCLSSHCTSWKGCLTFFSFIFIITFFSYFTLSSSANAILATF